MHYSNSEASLLSFDLDLPIECDDEYWVTSDPAQAFKQPPGKPAMISYFNCMLRLNQINAFAMRTIVSMSDHSCVQRPNVAYSTLLRSPRHYWDLSAPNGSSGSSLS